MDILGTEYTVIYKHDYEDDYLKTHSGYCDFIKKEIVLSRDNLLIETTIKHEVIHAFLYESGLGTSSDWADNEECIDWFARQWDKIQKVINGL